MRYDNVTAVLCLGRISREREPTHNRSQCYEQTHSVLQTLYNFAAISTGRINTPHSPVLRKPIQRLSLMSVLRDRCGRLPADNPDRIKDMRSKKANMPERLLSGFDRSPVEQAVENLRQALRVLELVPLTSSDLTPHPVVIVRAEIENARRYLGLIENQNSATA